MCRSDIYQSYVHTFSCSPKFVGGNAGTNVVSESDATMFAPDNFRSTRYQAIQHCSVQYDIVMVVTVSSQTSENIPLLRLNIG